VRLLPNRERATSAASRQIEARDSLATVWWKSHTARFVTRQAVKHSEGKIGKVRVVRDFLPPENLVLSQQNVKVTLSPSQRGVTLFKREAAKHRVRA